MKQAVPNVCLALSDDEDYVSFDEDDLNAGIQDLYDNDSAEDAGSDISNEEYFDTNQVELNQVELDQVGLGLNPRAATFIPRTPSPPPVTTITHHPPPPSRSPPPPPSHAHNNNNATVHTFNRMRANSARGRPIATGRGRGRPSGNRTRRSVSKTDDDLYNYDKSVSVLRNRSTTPEAAVSNRRKMDKKNEDLFESLNQINRAPKPLLQNRNRASLNANVYRCPPGFGSQSHLECAQPPFQMNIPVSIPAPALYIPSAPLPPPISSLSFAPRVSAFGSELSTFASLPRVSTSATATAPAPRSDISINRRKSIKLSKRIHKLNEMKQKKKKKRKHRKIIHKQKINTNVISVDLGTLKESAHNIATGDPVRCKNEACGAILSKYDTLLKTHDDIKLDDDDESIWICRFCQQTNIIEIDDEEMPSDETVDYIIEPPDDHKQKDMNKEDEEKQIIFCIDISGSMCVTQCVDGKKFDLKGDRLSKENDELSQFIDPMDRNQWMPNQKQNVTYISRLQSVQAAVDEQIRRLKLSHPNTKVGLVTFNNEVTVYGDGMNNNEIITGDKLNNLNKLKEIGASDTCAITHCIATSHANLSNKLWNLEEKGQTALGPALSVSIAMGAMKRGSQVILCTDGLSNIGVGNIDDNDNENRQRFYEDLGNWAMECGVVVSIISITDDGCNLEALGRIVEATNGNLRRINPLKLTDKFSGILDKEMIATRTNAKMLLHRGLKFVDTVLELQNLNPFEDDKDKDKEENQANPANQDNQDNHANQANQENQANQDKDRVPSSQQDIGNVFFDTTIFFEYSLNRDVIKHKNDFKQVKHLPFQVHISYNKLDGAKMLRVITQQKEVTYDKERVRQNLDYSVLSKYGTRITTKLCDVGDYEASRAFTNANTRYMHRHSHNPAQISDLASYVNSNIGLDFQMQQQQQSEINTYNQNNAYNASFSPAMNNMNNNWIARGVQMNNMRGPDINAAPAPAPVPQSVHFQAATPQQNLQQQSQRRTQRNDKFSTLQYGMKRKY